MPEITNAFHAVADDGEEIDIRELTTILDVSGSNDQARKYEPSKRYQTTDGRDVTHVEKGVYRLYGTEKDFRSDDPNAP